VLDGKALPAGAAERLEFARLCALKGLYGTAARFYAEALAERPALAANGHRYLAARAAVLAGLGQGKDVPALDDQERRRWRQQALTWLRADLEFWSSRLTAGGPEARAEARRALQAWRTDRSLAAVRDADGLAKLPEAERAGWRKLWADVEELRKRAGTPG
jgi:hypothetical protein